MRIGENIGVALRDFGAKSIYEGIRNDLSKLQRLADAEGKHKLETCSKRKYFEGLGGVHYTEHTRKEPDGTVHEQISGHDCAFCQAYSSK